MFNFEGTDYKSKSIVALNMLKEGKNRMEISKILGISYQTVHAIMKKSGLKAAKSKLHVTKKTKNIIPESQVIENAEAK